VKIIKKTDDNRRHFEYKRGQTQKPFSGILRTIGGKF